MTGRKTPLLAHLQRANSAIEGTASHKTGLSGSHNRAARPIQAGEIPSVPAIL